MKLESFSYHNRAGWSVADLPRLDSPQTLVITFGSSASDENAQMIRELAETYPQSKLIGCSTAGEIFGPSLNDNSLSVAVAEFDSTKLALAMAPVAHARESFAAGVSIGHQLLQPSLRGVLVLSDGLKVNGSDLVEGVNSVLPGDVPVTGGLAGDGERFQQTWVIKDGQMQSGYVSAVGFYGPKVTIGHGSKGGWDIFGPERKVTASEGNCLYELDGKPALQLYKEYLGERAVGLPATALLFPLALRMDALAEKRIVRTVLAVNEENQSMTFAGDIPQGAFVQLMRANFDRLIDGASEAALMTRRAEGTRQDTLSIAISCVGRRLILGERTEEELEAVMDALPKQTHQIGFYSYGEISPYATGHCDLHNQTMTLTTINEE